MGGGNGGREEEEEGIVRRENKVTIDQKQARKMSKGEEWRW